jgi:cytoskeletal protein RodZ
MAAERITVDFGGKLREARERKGVSLRTIAEATKISVGVLEALERNDVSRLPGGIFSRAFVRSYAAEVGLDPETTIQEFIAQFPQDSVTAGHSTAADPEMNDGFEIDPRVSRTVFRLVGIVVVIVGVGLYFGTGARRAWWSSLLTPLAGTVAATKPAAATTTPAPVPAPPPPVAAAAPPPPAEPPPAAPSADRLQVGLSARRPCWVSATVDGKKTIEQLLQVGDQRTIDIEREMVLTAGDAAAIALTLNGAAARPLGKTGEVITVRVNPANFKEYLASR